MLIASLKWTKTLKLYNRDFVIHQSWQGPKIQDHSILSQILVASVIVDLHHAFKHWRAENNLSHEQEPTGNVNSSFYFWRNQNLWLSNFFLQELNNYRTECWFTGDSNHKEIIIEIWVHRLNYFKFKWYQNAKMFFSPAFLTFSVFFFSLISFFFWLKYYDQINPVRPSCEFYRQTIHQTYLTFWSSVRETFLSQKLNVD